MVRDSAATKARILEAATAEFAAAGLAGARVDRIAERAGANKQLIYAYFGGKERLFDTTIETQLGRVLDAVPFDANDLPGYATRSYDLLAGDPTLLRLWRWQALERPGALARMPQAVESTLAKLGAVADAQAAGVVDASLPPEGLLDVVLALILGAAEGGVDGLHGLSGDLRGALAHAVSRLVEPR
jgi:AcrR family transcriptional regulator